MSSQPIQPPLTLMRPERPRRHLLAGLSVAALGAVAAVLYVGLPTAPAAKPAATAASAPVPVVLARATTQDLPIWLDAIGSVVATNTVTVRARVDGQLEQVLFEEGQSVHKGDLLAVIDPRPLQAVVNQARAQLAQEEARLASVQVDLRRASDLAAAGAGPTQAADTLRAQMATQTATVRAAQAALDSAQLQLGFTRITSPIDGRAGQRLVPAGSMVRAADAGGLVTVTQMRPTWVAFTVPQDELPRVLQQSRQSGAKHLTVQALLRDRSQVLASGVLDFVDSQVSPGVGQITLKARFDNADGALWPGQLVGVRLLLGTQQRATVIPAEAVQQGPKGSFVYVVDARQTAQARPVDAAAVVGPLQWIRSGLAPGDTVVAQGQYRVAPGVAVIAAGGR